MMKHSLRSVFLLSCLAVGTACGGAKPAVETAQAAQASLYVRLGETAGISAVVDSFLAKVVADARINGRFANTDAVALRTKLIDQLCQAAGGPCEYKGKDMKTAHTGMQVREDEFGALVEDLVAALDEHKVGEPEKAELLKALGGMHDDIVGH